MTEKIKSISNPLTIIAIFAALAEINATVSIGLVDKELQATFIWFVILLPTLLITLFFLTLNFNTKVIYAPSDYKDDTSFYKMLVGEPKPDKAINRVTHALIAVWFGEKKILIKPLQAFLLFIPTHLIQL